MAEPRICTIEGCGKTHYAKGWCRSHYTRWRCYGDPMGGGTFQGTPMRWLEEVALPFEGDECLTWPFSGDGKGYGRVWRDGSMHLVHRMVCERVHGPPPTPQHQAAHLCGKGRKGCCNQKHLEWKTPKENHADKLIHGTTNRGERHGRAKLTEAQVREIRAMDGLQSDIALRFGVSHQTIFKIKRRRSWAWID